MTSMLSYAGYATTTAGFAKQPDTALLMIQNIYFMGPMIIALLALIVLALYRLDKKYDKIMVDLAERESKGEL